MCPFGRVEIIRSSDNGESWSWPEIVMDSPIDDRDAGLCETADGTLLLTTFTSLAFQETRKRSASWPADKIARWDAVNRRASNADFESLLGTWMLRSTDGGLSWSKPYRVPLNSPHGPSVIANGRLLYAGKQLWETGKKVGVCESTDDGKSWKWLSDIPTRPATLLSNITNCTRCRQRKASSSSISGTTAHRITEKPFSANRAIAASRGVYRKRSAFGGCPPIYCAFVMEVF